MAWYDGSHAVGDGTFYDGTESDGTGDVFGAGAASAALPAASATGFQLTGSHILFDVLPSFVAGDADSLGSALTGTPVLGDKWLLPTRNGDIVWETNGLGNPSGRIADLTHSTGNIASEVWRYYSASADTWYQGTLATLATISGAGAANTPAPVAAGTGNAPVSGAGAASAPLPNVSADGDVAVVGTGAANAPTPVAGSSGTVTVYGVGRADAPLPVAAGTGTVPPIEVPTDTTPDPIVFPPRLNVPRNQWAEFAAQFVRGITAAVVIEAFAGAEYRIGSGDWTSTPGQVRDGDVVTARVMAPDEYSTQLQPVPYLNIGGINCPLHCTTLEPPVVVAEILVRPTEGVSAVTTTDNRLVFTVTDYNALVRTAKRR